MRYKDIWKINAYRWNLIAGMIGRLGDSIDMIGFSWMMYGLTESTLNISDGIEPPFRYACTTNSLKMYH